MRVENSSQLECVHFQILPGRLLEQFPDVLLLIYVLVRDHALKGLKYTFRQYLVN